MPNNIFNFIFVVGFIWILFNLTRTMIRDKKRMKILRRIINLVEKGKSTKDENVKEATKQEIFDILEKKL